MKSSSKTWAWLSRSQKYGWKYSNVKKYHCEAKNIRSGAPDISPGNGEKAGDISARGGDYDNLRSDTKMRGKV